MLKASSQILASGHSAAKGHPWTKKDRKQSSLISSSRSFQEMTHQVKEGAQTPFGKLSLASGGYTLPMSLLLASPQILAVCHLPTVVESG